MEKNIIKSEYPKCLSTCTHKSNGYPCKGCNNWEYEYYWKDGYGWKGFKANRENKKGIEMKVFEFNNDTNFDFPEDMKFILSYLNDVGKINPCISKKVIENFYKTYSEEVRNIGWIDLENDPERDNILEDFANWLSKKEI